MKKLLSFAIIVIGALLLGACSTIINTTSQNVEIRSEPANAKITIDGKKFGTTPQVINLERGSNHIVKLELDGYDMYETNLTRKISTVFWFNVFNGIVPGVLMDMFSGSMYNLLPEYVEVELQPAKPAPDTKKR